MQVVRKGSSGTQARSSGRQNRASEPRSTATARVQRLREKLIHTTPGVCAERARYLTEAYRQHGADPPVLRRAKALAHVLAKMTIYVDEGELLVGNQASRPRAAPIRPEYSSDWIEEEIAIQR